MAPGVVIRKGRMKEINYTDDLIVWTLRTEEQLSSQDFRNLVTFINKVFNELSFVVLNYEEDTYPLEPLNEGFIMTLGTADREWKEFIKYESSISIRHIDGLYGHVAWTRAEMRLISDLRDTFICLHQSYTIISFGGGNNEP